MTKVEEWGHLFLNRIYRIAGLTRFRGGGDLCKSYLNLMKCCFILVLAGLMTMVSRCSKNIAKKGF